MHYYLSYGYRLHPKVVTKGGKTMSKIQSSQPREWKELYIAALLEGDKDKMPLLIIQAEQAIVRRARELFKAEGNNAEEGESLDEALYALRALKTCLAAQGRLAEAA
jgi:hypothetical protein